MQPAKNARPAVPTAPSRWIRGRARYEGAAIALDPATVVEYVPLQDAEGSLWQLAAVRQPADAVTFARRFGLLRHGPGSEELSEPWADWEATALRLHLVLVAAAMLRDAERGDQDALAYIVDLTSRIGLDPAFEALRDVSGDRERTMVLVSEWVALMVKQGMGKTTLGIETDADFKRNGRRGTPGVFVFSPQPVDLLGWIYYELALTLVQGRPTRRCEGCGVMFLVTDGRRRFHDQRCAQRARYHRSAERRRQGQ
jgi:hypothetical protein